MSQKQQTHPATNIYLIENVSDPNDAEVEKTSIRPLNIMLVVFRYANIIVKTVLQLQK